jgi:hypothetical protein
MQGMHNSVIKLVHATAAGAKVLTLKPSKFPFTAAAGLYKKNVSALEAVLGFVTNTARIKMETNQHARQQT